VNLKGYSETELLEEVRDILAQPGEVSDGQRIRLEAINQEFQRREREPCTNPTGTFC
jgi:hypothetical protein